MKRVVWCLREYYYLQCAKLVSRKQAGRQPNQRACDYALFLPSGACCSAWACGWSPAWWFIAPAVRSTTATPTSRKFRFSLGVQYIHGEECSVGAATHSASLTPLYLSKRLVDQSGSLYHVWWTQDENRSILHKRQCYHPLKIMQKLRLDIL